MFEEMDAEALCNDNQRLDRELDATKRNLDDLRVAAKGLFDALEADPSNQNKPVWDAHECLEAALKAL